LKERDEISLLAFGACIVEAASRPPTRHRDCSDCTQFWGMTDDVAGL
jgi:hypothetical protein